MASKICSKCQRSEKYYILLALLQLHTQTEAPPAAICPADGGTHEFLVFRDGDHDED